MSTTNNNRAGQRRVVVYVDEHGKSKVHADEAAPRYSVYTAPKGFETSVLWGTPPGVALPTGVQDPAPRLESVVPERPGDTVFQILRLPPDSAFGAADFDPMVAAAEGQKYGPGIAERMEIDNPGFHRTDSIDYITVISGEVWCVADEGEVRLQAGDTLVQLGSRHAWQNRTESPAVLNVVMIGAKARG